MLKLLEDIDSFIKIIIIKKSILFGTRKLFFDKYRILNYHEWMSEFHFLTLSWKVENYLYIRFVCLSVHVLIFVNILWIYWNWYILLRFTVECFVLKMVYVGLTVRVQRHTKEILYVTINKIKFKTIISTCLYCTKCNENNTSH